MWLMLRLLMHLTQLQKRQPPSCRTTLLRSPHLQRQTTVAGPCAIHEFRVVASGPAGETPAQAAVLSWEDICCAVRVGGAAQLRQILTDVSGIAGAPDAGSTDGSNGSSRGGGGTEISNSDGSSGDTSNGGNCSGSRKKRGSGGSGGGGMCAILGPSGAGKTTLLDILAGRRYGAGALPVLPASHAAYLLYTVN